MRSATAIVVISAAAALFGTAPASAHAASPGLVVAPGANATATASPVRVTVRAPYGVATLRVTLNGRDVTSQLGDPDRTGRRTLTASASHGLRYGRNVVRVVRRDKRGARVRRSARTFRLTRARPLVGAGVDRTVAVGTSTRLNGRASRSRRAPRPARAAQAAGQAGTPAGLTMRWRLIRKPPGSAATLEQPLLSFVQPADTLIKPTSNGGVQPARPLIKPDKPGTYVAALQVADGVTSRTDTVTLTASMATPLVPIDTNAIVGQRGIAVGYHPAQQNNRAPQNPGEAFYPAGGPLHAVVLDRSTLEFVASYSQPASDAGVAAMASQLRGLNDAQLVLLAAWFDPGWAGVNGGDPLIALTQQTGPAGLIGAQDDPGVEPIYDALRSGGYASFVGVPGFGPGDGWQRVRKAPTTEGDIDTGLNGFLVPDSNRNYAYMGTAPQGFDLGPDGQSVTLQLGPTTYTAELPAGQGGFTVVYLDAQSLKASGSVPPGIPTQATYQTMNADGSPNIGEMQRMANDLQNVQYTYPGLLIAVRSIGAKPLAAIGYVPSGGDTTYADALRGLAGAVNSVGGLGQWILGMATQQQAQNSYSLLGGSQLTRFAQVQPQGRGTQTGSAARPAPASTRLQGILSRDREQLYAVRAAANTTVSPALAQTAVSEPVAWPYAGSAALACIGLAQGIGEDPRITYWQQTYDGSRWGEIQGAVRAMSPSACPSVPAEEFGEVQAQLVKEIGWVINVKSYIASLTEPFTADGLSSYADLTTVTNQVKQAVTLPDKATAGVNGWSIFTDILFILESLDVPVVGQIAAGLAFGQDVLADGKGGPIVDVTQQITAESDKLGQALTDQLQDVAANAEVLVDVLVSDYGRLSTVGQLGGCAPGPNCPAEWQFTQDQQNAASRLYEISAKRKIWGGMLPAAYPYVLTANSNPGSFNGTFMGPQADISSIGCGFTPAFIRVSTGKALKPPTFMQYGIVQDANTNFLVFSQQNFKGASERSTTFPPSALLGTPFGALDPGGDPDKGGLGIDQFEFMVDNWPQRTGSTSKLPAMVPWRGC